MVNPIVIVLETLLYTTTFFVGLSGSILDLLTVDSALTTLAIGETLMKSGAGIAD
jgi:hypothetical protein